MQNFNYFLGLVFVILTVSSCEKVIDIPLEDAERRVVIEAVLRDIPGENYVKLSKTGSVYDDSNFEKISDATVKVTDQSGTEFFFSPVIGQPGTYNHPTFVVQNDNSYSLEVATGTDVFTSFSRSYYTPKLDSLTYIEQIGSFGFGTDTTYLVFFSFVDKAGEENYYRVIPNVNGVPDGTYYVTNDELFDGQNYTQPIFATTVEKGDTVLMELLSMDKGAYSYFFSFGNASSDGQFGPTPGNPVSNIEGGAIGYFAVYTTDTLSLIIPQ